MIKMMFLCRRRPDITHEQFAERVLRGHVPLALQHHQTLRRYVMNVAEGTPEGGEELDSLPALYFDSLGDFTDRLYDSPEGEAIIHTDVATFMGGADVYATSEHVLKDATPPASPGRRSPGVKYIALLRRRPGLSHDVFVERWLTEHAAALRQELQELQQCVLNVVEARLSETGEDWDGIAEYRPASGADPRGASTAHARMLGHGDAIASVALASPVAEYVQK